MLRQDYSRAAAPPWTVMWFTTKLDHFTYSDTRTFKMKWLVNNTNYKSGGPIFFYTGNEGDIEGFATATGIMWDLAPKFNAAIVFAEHRFYGESLPFGNQSYSVSHSPNCTGRCCTRISIDNMGYLTSEQALADFAALLFTLKTPNNTLNVSFPESAPVISFGGSYAAHIFRAWAASAPLIYFKGGGVDQGAFDKVTTKTFVDAGTNRFVVANSWNAILNLSSTVHFFKEEGRQFLNKQFNIDPKSQIKKREDGWLLNGYIREALEYMAMVDYPYSTGFLEPLPAWPVKAASEQMSAPGSNFTDEHLATMVCSAANIYYNSTGALEHNCIDPSVCGDPGTAGLGDDQLGWPWQVLLTIMLFFFPTFGPKLRLECSEIVIDMCARGGSNDFFWNECKGDSKALLAEQCEATFETFNWTTNVWNIRAVPLLYGLSLAGASNIILTQGQLDPWSAGGYQPGSSGDNQDRGLYVLQIPGAAHHLDLRTPNTCDPNTVTNARYQVFEAIVNASIQIVQILDCWIKGCSAPPKLATLPSMVVPSVAECKDVNQGYPWNQTKSGGSLSVATVMLSAVLLLNLLL
ncbi:serine carboxypeptidase S28 [Necator americanus]|uniref:Serine carboxypeptidase S28 n=1 Tax=Necator americanus TaxID=51031 RepID=W2T091_NECAM|nr:serine carboxypeptidase S28 [Necator americanus]ETN74979.1 serine carboxypeptidase S28 [Necator americanus]